VEGGPTVEKVLRQENLAEEYRAMAEELGIDGELGMYNVSSKRDFYRDVYDDETRRLVETFLREDLVNLGYEF
jgi:hypothetical protein